MQTRPARPLWPNPSLQNQLTGQSTPWPRPRPVFVRCSLVPRLHPTHARIKEKGSGHVTNGKRMETDINTESFCNHSNLLGWAIAEYLVVAKRSSPSDIGSEPDPCMCKGLVPRLASYPDLAQLSVACDVVWLVRLCRGELVPGSYVQQWAASCT